MNIPDQLMYTREHEWIRVEGDEIVIGVTDFAQGELGDVVFIEIETGGETLSRGDTFGTIEAVNPELVNSSPFDDGWMIRVKMSDPGQLEDLLSAEDYRSLIG